ncbi:MAG: DUF4440 domain-containing protein [Pseudomonadota bacterium]
MKPEELWQVERRFWLEGASVYEARLHGDALMIFPGVGILDRAQIIASLRDAPRWTALDMRERRMLQAGDILVLAYRAEARRGEDDPYRAFCSSSYISADSGWKMLFHQQTPAPKACDAP